MKTPENYMYEVIYNVQRLLRELDEVQSISGGYISPSGAEFCIGCNDFNIPVTVNAVRVREGVKMCINYSVALSNNTKAKKDYVAVDGYLEHPKITSENIARALREIVLEIAGYFNTARGMVKGMDPVLLACLKVI